MLGNTLRLECRWVVEGNVREVSDIIGALERLPEWWPSVYLTANRVARGDRCGVGASVDVRARGWLPIIVQGRLTIAAASPPKYLEILVSGGVSGWVRCSLTQDGPRAILDFVWEIRVEQAGLRQLAPMLRPLIAANQRWAAARGEESLRLELLRRRAKTAAEREQIPPPPGPAYPHRHHWHRWTARMVSG